MQHTVNKKLKIEVAGQKLCTSIEPVLADKYLAPIELVDVYACQVTDKKKTSEILRHLSVKYPLDQYPHIKRVKSSHNNGATNLQIIVCEKSPHSDEEIRTVLEPFSESVGCTGVVKIPANPPLTRGQFNNCIQYWPVNFHENKIITKLLAGTFFTGDQLKLISNHMMEAVQMAQMAKCNKQIPVGAVVVDPVTDKVIAKAYDMRNGSHPLHHATMVCIDLVAISQGGGMWKYTNESDFYSAKQEFVETKESGTENKTGPYLCTGYHLYITQEPCVILYCIFTAEVKPQGSKRRRKKRKGKKRQEDNTENMEELTVELESEQVKDGTTTDDTSLPKAKKQHVNDSKPCGNPNANIYIEETASADINKDIEDAKADEVKSKHWNELQLVKDATESETIVEHLCSNPPSHIAVCCVGQNLGLESSQIQAIIITAHPDSYMYYLRDDTSLVKDGHLDQLLMNKDIHKVFHDIGAVSSSLINEYDILMDGTPIWDIKMLFNKVTVARMDLEELNFKETIFKKWTNQNEEYGKKMAAQYDPAVAAELVERGKLIWDLHRLCFKCAMALVHSRIQRVYYGSCQKEGALGSAYKLHVQEGLNHHYEVFKGVMEADCDDLFIGTTDVGTGTTDIG